MFTRRYLLAAAAAAALAVAAPALADEAIAALPFAPPKEAAFDGRRESNNSTRVYLNPAVQAQHLVCAEIAEAFNTAAAVDALKRLTGADLGVGQLRIEYCQDVHGFWLEPHCDISAKLITTLLYLSDDPDLADAGTDIYDASPEHTLVGCAPYARNVGLVFRPGVNAWQEFSKRPIRGPRKSIIIINFVKPEWRSRENLAFP